MFSSYFKVLACKICFLTTSNNVFQDCLACVAAVFGGRASRDRAAIELAAILDARVKGKPLPLAFIFSLPSFPFARASNMAAFSIAVRSLLALSPKKQPLHRLKIDQNLETRKSKMAAEIRHFEFLYFLPGQLQLIIRPSFAKKII